MLLKYLLRYEIKYNWKIGILFIRKLYRNTKYTLDKVCKMHQVESCFQFC